MLANVIANQESADTMLHELGHGVYDLGLSDELPWLLRSAHVVATEASAIFFGSLARKRDWLELVLGLGAGEGAELAERLRASEAAELLVFARWVLVMNAFERGLYADPDRDLDALWWELVSRFQGVTPPDGRRAPDWAAKIHVAVVPVYYHGYLYGKIVALQIAAALEARRRHRGPARSGSAAAGRALRPRAVGALGPARRAGDGRAARRRLARSRGGGRRRMSELARLVTEPTEEESERKTSYLELFFDLVFVFAFTQVTALILEDTSLAGFARATLVLAMVWWAWSAYTWMTNAIDVENSVTRMILLAAMTAAFFMALAVPHAFQDEAAWFAVAYFVVRVLNATLYSWGARRDRVLLHSLARLMPWFLLAACVALAGGFVRVDYRGWVWLASLVIDIVGTLTVARVEWHVSPSHFAERFALIVIIALGESIVSIGVATAGLERDATYALSVVVAFAGVAALWWAYFDFTAVAAERSLRRATGPQARAARARRLHVLPLPDGARDHVLRLRRQEDARAPARSALEGGPLGPRARDRALPRRLRARSLPRHPEGGVGADRGGGARARGGSGPPPGRCDRDARSRRRGPRPVGRRRDGEAARDPGARSGRPSGRSATA